jgi:hypothetical protein
LVLRRKEIAERIGGRIYTREECDQEWSPSVELSCWNSLLFMAFGAPVSADEEYLSKAINFFTVLGEFWPQLSNNDRMLWQRVIESENAFSTRESFLNTMLILRNQISKLTDIVTVEDALVWFQSKKQVPIPKHYITLHDQSSSSSSVAVNSPSTLVKSKLTASPVSVDTNATQSLPTNTISNELIQPQPIRDGPIVNFLRFIPLVHESPTSPMIDQEFTHYASWNISDPPSIQSILVTKAHNIRRFTLVYDDQERPDINSIYIQVKNPDTVFQLWYNAYTDVPPKTYKGSSMALFDPSTSTAKKDILQSSSFPNNKNTHQNLSSASAPDLVTAASASPATFVPGRVINGQTEGQAERLPKKKRVLFDLNQNEEFIIQKYHSASFESNSQEETNSIDFTSDNPDTTTETRRQPENNDRRKETSTTQFWFQYIIIYCFTIVILLICVMNMGLKYGLILFGFVLCVALVIYLLHRREYQRNHEFSWNRYLDN